MSFIDDVFEKQETIFSINTFKTLTYKPGEIRKCVTE